MPYMLILVRQLSCIVKTASSRLLAHLCCLFVIIKYDKICQHKDTYTIQFLLSQLILLADNENETSSSCSSVVCDC